jgi:hypothetical protein
MFLHNNTEQSPKVPQEQGKGIGTNFCSNESRPAYQHTLAGSIIIEINGLAVVTYFFGHTYLAACAGGGGSGYKTQ